MNVKDLVKIWNEDRGPFGGPLWCDIKGCLEFAHAYVQSGTRVDHLCREHYKEFTHELAYPSSAGEGEVE